jgi:hypothetical protein
MAGGGKKSAISLFPSGGAAVPWALTRNKGFWEEGDTLDTLLYIDGLKRVVQTKKEVEVLQGDVKKEKGDRFEWR